MSNSTPTLTEAAAAVVGFGSSSAEIDGLDEAALVAGMAALRQLDEASQQFRVWFAASIARRSDHTLGYDGLARKNGFHTGNVHPIPDRNVEGRGDETCPPR